MKIGYARVSTEDQNLELQRQALTAAGCEVIYEDKGISGAAVNRPGLAKALERVGPGDVLVVWRLDRFGRSLADLIAKMEALAKREVGFQSLADAIDTTTASGRLLFHVTGAMAEFERSLISERTRAGMKAAKRRGKHLGRPVKLNDQQLRHARELIDAGRMRADVAALFEVDPSTLFRRLQAAARRQKRA